MSMKIKAAVLVSSFAVLLFVEAGCCHLVDDPAGLKPAQKKAGVDPIRA